MFEFFFFFSSRRRHTRYWRDWSSDVCSSDLTDDLKTQPAENIAPLVRNDYLAKVDAASFEALLNAVSAKLTTADLTTLGVDIAVNQQDVPTVAKNWLTTAGLLP